MATTEEDLQARRERNEELRAQIAAEQAARYDAQASLANDVTAAQLDAETARLEAALAAEQRQNEGLKAGASAPLEAAKNAMEQAVAAQKAAEQAAKEQEKVANKQDKGGTPEEREQAAADAAAKEAAKSPAGTPVSVSLTDDTKTTTNTDGSDKTKEN